MGQDLANIQSTGGTCASLTWTIDSEEELGTRIRATSYWPLKTCSATTGYHATQRALHAPDNIQAMVIVDNYFFQKLRNVFPAFEAHSSHESNTSKLLRKK